MTTEKRDQIVGLRLTKSEREWLEEHAHREALPLSLYIRSTLFKAVKEGDHDDRQGGI